MTKASNRAARNREIIDARLASHGSVCACGCQTALQQGDYHWHHRDNTVKLGGISELRRSTASSLRAELDKCVPMKPACHLQGCHGH
jgi:hypothetical protein